MCHIAFIHKKTTFSLISTQKCRPFNAVRLLCMQVPYPRDVKEPTTYESVTLHAELSTAEDGDAQDVRFSLNTKEGFLTKVGLHFKTWKTRWFVLRRNQLSYFKEKGSKAAIRVLDLEECESCAAEDERYREKGNVFRLVFKWRTFYLYATSTQDMLDWIKRINWCLHEHRNQ